MYERDIDPYEELTDEFCNFLEAHPWHCEAKPSNWVHVPDEPEVQNGPYCPMDALDALEHCGRLAYMIANGETVSPEEAARAAGRAVKCFTCYEYEQQEWFIDALRAATEREANGIGTDDKPRDPPADGGSGDKCERNATT